MNTSPIILILGAGPNIGQHVARAFAAKGYKVALVSRQPRERDNTADLINISGDLSDPNSVIQAFSKVKALLGLPSVVVYNGGNRIQYLIDRCANILEAAAATANDANNPLSLPLADITRDLSINTTSAFVAAQQAVLSFAELPDSVSETFMYTGNILNTTTIAPLMSLGIGKSGTAHLIQSAAAAYADRGFKYTSPTPIALDDINKRPGSIMATNGMLMDRLLTSTLMERPMGTSMYNSLSTSHKGHGSRHLSKVWGTRISHPIYEGCSDSLSR